MTDGRRQLAPEHRRTAIDEATRAKARRGAWVLGLLAATFYIGFIAWNAYRASAGF